ncbi:MotE family protein [Albimonas pacifica]|uniref:Flagellar motility protein MotE, a chaperone for MotC folding n=1 Tax=Albimonas pacifica TaxID=1114924 RepID=A0A1I3FQP9_9RHOB|nr:hypothetical protein [Albimonas pacifica]SFI13563.1 Flagellar motility protein MotE, a chaperone for MotC folding [Albimonas pacifica]
MIDLRALLRSRRTPRPPAPAPRSAAFPAGPAPRRRPPAEESGSRGARRAPGALLLLGLCFLGSAGLRLLDPEGALAKEAAATLSGGGAQTAAADPCTPGGDPAGLLAALKQRETQLDARAAEIADRERLLQVAEAKYKEQLEALRTAEERLAATLAVADEAAEQDIERLTAVYENMNPKNAARIFESMDVTFAAGFLARMRKDTAAKIMGGMSAERAYAISAVIAGRNARAPRE